MDQIISAIIAAIAVIVAASLPLLTAHRKNQIIKGKDKIIETLTHQKNKLIMEKDVIIETLSQRVETFETREHGFAQWGMLDLRRFSDADTMGTFLRSCRREVIILKTWFPEDEEIAGGLEAAVAGGATIQMILCDPKAPILGMRAQSTEDTQEQAARWIHRGLTSVFENAAPRRFNGVRFYNAWPGCPVIWADGRIFMGFYFWGHTSPNQPWVEVEVPSTLERLLEAQKDKIWEVVKKENRLETLDELGKWIKDNPLDELLKWIRDDLPPPDEEAEV